MNVTDEANEGTLAPNGLCGMIFIATNVTTLQISMTGASASRA
jgi:hypothetical protein